MTRTIKTVFNQRGIYDAAPVFDPEMWRERDRFRFPLLVSCIGYAANIRDPRFESFQSEIDDKFPYPDLFNISSEIQAYGFLPISEGKLENISKGHYPVMLFFDMDKENGDECLNDYHWVRMDSDGKWSEKLWNKLPEIEAGITENPLSNPLSDKRYDTFGGYFMVPAGGICLDHLPKESPAQVKKIHQYIKKSLCLRV